MTTTVTVAAGSHPVDVTSIGIRDQIGRRVDRLQPLEQRVFHVHSMQDIHIHERSGRELELQANKEKAG